MPQESLADEMNYGDLLTIPGVGPGKAKVLMQAGYPSINALKSAPVEEIAAVRYIGQSLAQRIKAFVDQYVSEEAALPQEGQEMEAMPAPDILIFPAEEAEAALSITVETVESIEAAEFPVEEASPAGDRWLIRLQEALGRIGGALQNLSAGLEQQTFRKRLSRQLERSLSLLENLPTFEGLSRNQRKSMAKTLTGLAGLFESLTSDSHPGKKRQRILALKLRQRRKKLARIGK